MDHYEEALEESRSPENVDSGDSEAAIENDSKSAVVTRGLIGLLVLFVAVLLIIIFYLA